MNDSEDTSLIDIAEDSWLSNIDYRVASAWTLHAPFMKFLIRSYRPKIFVELGVHFGFSYFVACQAVKELNLETRCFGVDNWLGDEHSGSYAQNVFESATKENQNYLDFSILMRMNFDKAVENFAGNSVDLLHIDGFHTYEQVKHDFETWLPKLSANSIVLFHDIEVRHGNFGVFRFWKEVKHKYKNFEFSHGNGLGIIFIGDVSSDALFGIKETSGEPLRMALGGVFGVHGDFVGQNIFQSTQLELQSTQLELQSTQLELQSTQLELQSTQLELQSTQLELQSTLQTRSWRYTRFIRIIFSKLSQRKISNICIVDIS